MIGHQNVYVVHLSLAKFCKLILLYERLIAAYERDTIEPDSIDRLLLNWWAVIIRKDWLQ